MNNTITLGQLYYAYKEADVVIRAKQWSYLTYERHKQRIMSNLVKAGLSAEQADELFQEAMNLKVSFAVSSGGMTFINSRELVEAARRLHMIKDVVVFDDENKE